MKHQWRARLWTFLASGAKRKGTGRPRVLPALEALEDRTLPTATHFSLVGLPATTTAGGSLTFTLTALTQSNTTATDYTGTVDFTSSDAQALTPGNSTLTNGVGTFSVTLKTAGTQTVSATDTANSTITGSATVTVSAVAASHFGVSIPPSASAWVAFGITVTAQDPFNNTATSYLGTVQFTTSDTGTGSAVPANYTFVAADKGTHTFPAGAILVTPGQQSIAVSNVAATINGSASVNITVSSYPFVLSINRTNPAGPVTNAATVSYTVTFNEAVTGVNANAFQLALGGTVAATQIQVTPSSASVYTVTVGGITGIGTLGLNLVDIGTIRDLAGNLLNQPNAPASFQEKTFAAGSESESVALGDVNGDGKPDLVVANYGSNTVSVLLGNGNGTFQLAQNFATGSIPTSVAVADVNGDGKLDLVVANLDSSTVSVLLGNGNGTFQLAQNFATGSEPVSVAVADVNGDGKPDIVVADYKSSTVSVLLGNGNGTFQLAQNFATGNDPRSVAVADVNGDGKPDLVVANKGSNTVSVLLGNGNGTFQSAQTFAAGMSPISVAVADINGDGKPDIVVANYGSNTVSLLLGNGNGTFQPAQNFAAGGDPQSVAVADVNGDGKPDLVVANESGNTVSVRLGNGNGTFQLAQNFATGSEPFSVAVADVNGDSKPDIVVANFVNTVSVLLNADNGNFTGQIYTISGASATHFALTGIPATITAGASTTFTVTALDPSNNIVPGYTGTVHFTSTDTNSQAFVPADYTFTAADAGLHVFVNGVKLVAAGNQTVTVTDTATGSITGTSNIIAVTPAQASHLALNVPAIVTAGLAFNFTATALDPFNNTVSGYAGTVHFTTSDSAATPPTNGTLVGGVGTFSIALKTVGSQTLTATDTIASSITGTSSTITVQPSGGGSVTAAPDFYSVTERVLTTDPALTAAAPGVLANDTVTPADPLTAALITAPANGTVTLSSNGSFVYTPNPAYLGADSFVYKAVDSTNGNSANATVTVSVTPRLSLQLGPATIQAPGPVTGAAATNSTLAIYVNVDDSDPTGSGGLDAADFYIDFNPSVFYVNTGNIGAAPDIQLGSLTNPVNPIQAITFSPSDTGSFTLAFNNTSIGGVISGTTGPITYTTNIATLQTNVQNALNSLVGLGNTQVIAYSSTNVGVQFTGSLGTVTQPSITVSNYSMLTGPSPPVSVGVPDWAGANASLADSIQFASTVTGGTFSLAIDNTLFGGPINVTTGPIGYSTNPSTLQANIQSAFDTFLGPGLAKVRAPSANTVYVGYTPSGVPPEVTLGTSNLTVTTPTTSTVTVIAQLGVSMYSNNNIPDLGTAAGSLVSINFHVKPNAPTGVTSINLDPLGFYNGTSSTLNSSSFGSPYFGVLPIRPTLPDPNVNADVNIFLGQSLQVSAPTNTTAGAPFSVTLTEVNSSGNVNTSYTGTVHFTTSDTGAKSSLPQDYTFTAADQGVHAFSGTNSATLVTAGTQTITATDLSSIITGSATVTVSPAAAAQFNVNAPINATAGTPLNFTVTALDPFGNTATAYTGTVHFTSSDSLAVLPADSALTSGTGVFAVTFKTLNTETLTATDTAASSIKGTTGPINVSAAGVTHFAVTSAPASVVAGSLFILSITAEDQFNNIVASYAGTVHFTSSDAQAGLPSDATLTSGTGFFAATLRTAGSQIITATDTVNSISNHTGPISVTPGAAAHFAVTAAATTTAGNILVVSVTAQDQFNNTVTNYNGTVHFTSTDPGATLPSDSTLTGGVASFANVLLVTGGTRTITVTDVSNSAISGSTTVTVLAASVKRLSVSAVGSTAAGSPVTVTVKALDSFGNTVSSYAGTVRLTSSDAGAVLPANTTLTGGSGSFNATLVTAGSQTITATDTMSASINGSASVNVRDIIYPFVQSINRTTPAGPTTNASTVTYTVTFSEPVTGVSAADFQLTVSGTAAATVTQVTPVSTSVYTVAVSGITGNGTLGLNLVDNGSIHDLAGTPLTQANGQTAFQAPQTFAAGSGLNSLALVDVNGDGKLDIVGANAPSNTVSVLLGNGNGTFQTLQSFSTGAEPLAVAVGDVNGDGKPDLVVANLQSKSVSVLLGNGNGTFQAQQTFATGYSPISVALGDVNGDGKPDIAVANLGSGTVSILLGNGNGTFQTQQTIPTGAEPRAVAFGDVNGDGKLDLLVANTRSNTVSVLLGNGNGTFQAQQTFATDANPYSVALGDVDGDGKPDIAVANQGSNTVGVLLGNGNGTFQAQQTFATGYSPESVVLGDVNGDGNPDIIVANGGSSTVGVLLGNGNGTFQAQQTLSTGGGASSVAVGDVNGDGRPDLVVPNGVLLGAGNGNFTGQVYTIFVPHFFVFSVPNAMTAGNTVSITVTAVDPSNNTVTGYTGTVHFTTSDLGGAAVVPADYTFVASDNGQHVIANGVKLVTAGNQTVTVTDTATGSITGTSNIIAVTPAQASRLVLNVPAIVTAGLAFNFTATALDPFNNTVSGYTGTVHFSTTDGQAIPPGNTTLTNGRGTFSITLATAGNQTLTATDIGTSGITGTSAPISVQLAPATHFVIAGIPSSITAGMSVAITVTAEDQFNNNATGYVGMVHFTTSDSQAIPPINSSLTSGVGVFAIQFKTAGSQTLIATDTATASITGSSTITVVPAAANHLAISGTPTSITAGTAFAVTVAALDPFGNTATAYSGTVHFATSDGVAAVPANSTMTNGKGVFSITLKTSGNQSLTATDTATSNITGTANTITVVSGPATHIAVSGAPNTVAAGGGITLTVIAQDQFNNTATGYPGTIHFTSSDSQAGLPPNTTLNNGIGFFSVTLKTPGSQTITVTDTGSSAITATTNTISVSAVAATHFAVSAPATLTAGNVIVFTVIAQDQFNNTVTGYTGNVRFTSADSQAVLPSNSTLTRGIGFFAAVLRTAGNQTLTATDTSTSNLTGSATVSVGAAAVAHFAVNAPTSIMAGNPFVFSVTAQDQFNNTVTAYAGTVRFNSSDGQAVLPANGKLTNGFGLFGAILMTGGNQTLTATDTVTSSINGTSSGITVFGNSPAAATHFTVVAPANTIAGNPFVFTVTALDQFNNIAGSYSGTVHLSSSDGQAALAVSTTVTGGTGFFATELRTAGNQTITATDSASSGITGTSATITVAGLAANHFAITAPTSAITGNAFSITVTAEDQFGNAAANYSGTVHFTSSDTSAILSANGTLTAGSGVFSAVLKTPGTQTIIAVDTAASTITGTSNNIATLGLVVTSLTPTPTGFVAVFNKPFNPALINLYDSLGTYGADDVLLTGPGATQTSFRGSLIIDPSDQTITFVKTSTFTSNVNSFNPQTGVLAAGTYTVTFRSATNGFVDALGAPLDATASGNPAGSNYTTTFVVASTPTEVVGVPGFARGPNSAATINLPNNLAFGIPLNLSTGAGVTAGKFTLQYNSALLSITGVTVNSSLTGATLTLDAASTAGSAVIDFSSSTALTAGPVRLGGLVATVPNSAAPLYTDKALLHWSSVSINGSSTGVTGDDAVEVDAYFGDANGDGTLSSEDASLISRVATGLDNNPATGVLGGFAAFRLADPVLIGDLNSNGSVGAGAVTLMNSLLAGTARPQIPAIPTGLTIPQNGVDPALSIPTDLQATAGGTVVVPVQIDSGRPQGNTGMMEAILAVQFDPAEFTVSTSDIALGTLPLTPTPLPASGERGEGSGWQLDVAINNTTGQIGIDLFGTTPIQTTAGGTLVTITFQVRESAPLGSTGINLVAALNPTGFRPFVTTVSDAQGGMVLHLVNTALGTMPGAPGEVTLSSGQWVVGSEQRAASGEQWPVGSGQWAVNGGQLAVNSKDQSASASTVHFALSTALPMMLAQENTLGQPGAILNSSFDNQSDTGVSEQAFLQQLGGADHDWAPTDLAVYLAQTGKAGRRSPLDDFLDDGILADPATL